MVNRALIITLVSSSCFCLLSLYVNMQYWNICLPIHSVGVLIMSCNYSETALTKGLAWAGASHWKFRKAPSQASAANAGGARSYYLFFFVWNLFFSRFPCIFFSSWLLELLVQEPKLISFFDFLVSASEQDDHSSIPTKSGKKKKTKEPFFIDFLSKYCKFNIFPTCLYWLLICFRLATRILLWLLFLLLLF